MRGINSRHIVSYFGSYKTDEELWVHLIYFSSFFLKTHFCFNFHSFILPFNFHSFTSSLTFKIFMEYCGLGSVNDALKAFKKGLTEAEIAYVLEDTLKGLRDLHKLGYIHRDIKSANILLNDKAQVKLGTFLFLFILSI